MCQELETFVREVKRVRRERAQAVGLLDQLIEEWLGERESVVEQAAAQEEALFQQYAPGALERGTDFECAAGKIVLREGPEGTWLRIE